MREEEEKKSAVDAINSIGRASDTGLGDPLCIRRVDLVPLPLSVGKIKVRAITREREREKPPTQPRKSPNIISSIRVSNLPR